MTTKYLTIDDVCEMLSISRRSFERMRSDKSSISNIMRNMGEERNENSILSKPTNLFLKQFPDPDLHIGRSPRWEKNKLISWLEEFGNEL